MIKSVAAISYAGLLPLWTAFIWCSNISIIVLAGTDTVSSHLDQFETSMVLNRELKRPSVLQKHSFWR